MQTPTAIILAVNESTATVAVEQNAACPRCASGKGCGAGLLNGRSRKIEMNVAVDEGNRFRAGDEVVLELAPANLLMAAVFAYGLPLIGLVSAVTLAALLIQPLSDLAAILAGVAGLGGGIALGRLRLRGRECLRQFVPTISPVGKDQST